MPGSSVAVLSPVSRLDMLSWTPTLVLEEETYHLYSNAASSHAPFKSQVWIISRHYSDDQRMGSLFQRIAQEIGDRVESAIDLSQIFRVPPPEALKLIKACKSVLEHWYMRYMEVRPARAGVEGM